MSWSKVRVELDEMVNLHFETPEYRRLFSVKLTPPGSRSSSFITRITSKVGVIVGRLHRIKLPLT